METTLTGVGHQGASTPLRRARRCLWETRRATRAIERHTYHFGPAARVGGLLYSVHAGHAIGSAVRGEVGVSTGRGPRRAGEDAASASIAGDDVQRCLASNTVRVPGICGDAHDPDGLTARMEGTCRRAEVHTALGPHPRELFNSSAGYSRAAKSVPGDAADAAQDLIMRAGYPQPGKVSRGKEVP